jgi:ribosome-associated translation inhibitor RaiA
MRITLRNLHHEPSPSLIELLEKELAALSTDLHIDEARVSFERRLDGSPPFRVTFHLVTPGPDVEAETTDHTLRAALIKAIDVLRGKIGHRHQKRARRKAEDVAGMASRRPAIVGSRR